MTKDELKLVKEFLDSQKIDPLNTRLFKISDKFVITVGSIDESKTRHNIAFKNRNFDIKYGEFSPYLKDVNENLK